MNIFQIVMWIALYITLVTIIFNFLRYGIELNLPSSLILSTSVSFLMCRIRISESVGVFFVENVWSIIVSAVLVTIIVATSRPINKTGDSAIKANNQKKTNRCNRVIKYPTYLVLSKD